jgi:two-component system NtrC family response regulator
LRALQEKKIRQLGSDKELVASARIVAATHQDLEQAIKTGSFREDLYARLAQLVIDVPPLRDRRTEILDLVRTFAGEAFEVTADAAEALLIWDYPRNIRELETLISTFGVMSEETKLTLEGLKDINVAIEQAWHEAQREPPHDEEDDLGSAKRAEHAEQLRQLLIEEDGNVSAVARRLAKSRPSVYRMMARLGVSLENLRQKS